jgi:cell wall-associated NlpC family hydrolase
MSIARRAVSYAVLSTVLAVFATALVAAMPGAQAWAEKPGGVSVAAPEPTAGEEGEVTTAKLVRGRAIAPRNAPRAVKRAIAFANRIRNRPYVWGGGHQRWWDRGYDCSGAVSYALRGAEQLESPLPSGPLMQWGERGVGRWISVFANQGHTYAVIAGLRWDTSGTGGKGPRWQEDMRSRKGFVARHPEGL